MHTLLLFVASFGQFALPPVMPALPQAVSFELPAACPASCTCKDCKCQECKGECKVATTKAHCRACAKGLFCPYCSCSDGKSKCVCVPRGKIAKSSDKVGFSPVAQSCPGGVCQLPAAKPKAVYAPRPQVQYLPRYSSGNCANGNCSQPQRRGLFGRR